MVTIEAENRTLAGELATFFTSDIHDLSSEKDREEYNFLIQEIETTHNEVYEITEL